MKKYKILWILFLAVIILFSSCASSKDNEDEFTVESNWEYSDLPGDDENQTEDYYYQDSEKQDNDADEPEEEYSTESEDIGSYDGSDEAGEDGYLYEQINLSLFIDGVPLMVEWEDNDAVRELNSMIKEGALSVKMERYGDFEQVGSLGFRLSRSDEVMNAQPGDIVLYSGNRIAVFYGENTWAYTPLGRIIGMSENELMQILGGSKAELVISAG